MNEAEERKLYEDWLHQSPEFADTIISAWDVWLGRAALAQPEPAGWKLVPIKATEEMLFRAELCHLRGYQRYQDLYEAMLAATPSPQEPKT